MLQDNKLHGYLKTVGEEFHRAGATTTANGEMFNLLEFTPAMVSENFIINALAKIHRYNGQNPETIGYSVAQHSYLMAEACLLVTGNPFLAWDCLWHDGSEAYTGDIVRPLKNLIREVFGDLELFIEKTIAEVIGTSFPLPPEVKNIDMNICEYEITHILNPETDIERFDIWEVEKSIKMFKSMRARLKRLMQIKNQVNDNK